MKSIAKAKRSVVRQIRSGVRFTKLGEKYYTNAKSPYGDKVSEGNRLAINQLLQEGVVKFEGDTLKLTQK